MLEINHLYKILDLFSLKDINMIIPTGYIMGLVGANGSGKSALIKTILNVYKKDSGTILLNGISMDQDEVAIKNQIGIILDENYLDSHLTIEQNAATYGRFYQNYQPKEFERYCNQFHLDTKQKGKKISKGMQMKFQLAFALSHDAKLLLLDEPTASLDPSFRKELYHILLDLIADGEHSILISTQLTEELDRIADYITFLSHGSVLLSDSKENLLDQYQIVKAPDYKIRLLPQEIIIHKEISPYATTALIQTQKHLDLSDGYDLLKPSIEDLMYYFIKEEKNHVPFNV